MAKLGYAVLIFVTCAVLLSAYYIQTTTFSKAKHRDNVYQTLSQINTTYNNLTNSLWRCMVYADVSQEEFSQNIRSLQGAQQYLESVSSPYVDTTNVVDQLQYVINHVSNLRCIEDEAFTKKIQKHDEPVLQKLFESNLIPMTQTIKFNYKLNQQAQREMVFNYIKTVIAFFLSFIALVAYFIYHNNKEKKNLRKLQESLEISLVTDPLSGFGNRNAAQKALKGCDKDTIVVLFNIVKFKHINDFYGVHVGDYVLKALSMKLKKVLSGYEKTALYRVGGDDFVVLCKKLEYQQVYKMAQEVLQFFQKEGIEYSDTVIDIALVAGITDVAPHLETVDLAAKKAKSSKSKSIVTYSQALDTTHIVEKNINAVKMLKDGIANDRFFPQFQPIVDLKSGKVTKYEALIRLRNADGTVIYPNSFIEEAKDSKLLNKLTKIMLIKSFEIFKHVDCSFSINLSFSEIIDQKNQDAIIEIIDSYGRHAKKLTFEILEDEAIDDYGLLDRFLNKVSKFGVDIAIDDFGSGYSNFGHIISMDTQILKIDGSLIKIVDYDIQARVLVKSIVDFAKSMQIKTVAEFVHSKDVMQMAQRLGIDYAQGFYLGKPSDDLQNLECGYDINGD